MRPAEIENGRIIVINESTIYGGSAEYHCVPLYNRIGPYLRKCMENGLWSGEEPRCECKNIILVEFQIYLSNFLVAVNDAQESGGLGTGIAIGAAIIVILLVLIMLIFLHRYEVHFNLLH